jgi:hypothetical protein
MLEQFTLIGLLKSALLAAVVLNIKNLLVAWHVRVRL